MSGIPDKMKLGYQRHETGLYPCMFSLHDPDFSYDRERPRTSLEYREQVEILRAWCRDQFGPRSTVFHRGRWWTTLAYRDKRHAFFGFREAEATVFKMRWW